MASQVHVVVSAAPPAQSPLVSEIPPGVAFMVGNTAYQRVSFPTAYVPEELVGRPTAIESESGAFLWFPADARGEPKNATLTIE